MPNIPWIGVDLDGTLAEWHGDIDSVGKPIEPMVARVKKWLSEGLLVKIVTARVAVTGQYVDISARHDDEVFARKQRILIENWCIDNLGTHLPITACKDFAMVSLWDDRCVAVETNTGRLKEPPLAGF